MKAIEKFQRLLNCWSVYIGGFGAVAWGRIVQIKLLEILGKTSVSDKSIALSQPLIIDQDREPI